jgi:hypothetical protein
MNSFFALDHETESERNFQLKIEQFYLLIQQNVKDKARLRYSRTGPVRSKRIQKLGQKTDWFYAR